MKEKIRFRDWCEKDPYDERKIYYVFRHSNGKITRFTSEDEVDFVFFFQISTAWVLDVKLDINESGEEEWYIELMEDDEV